MRGLQYALECGRYLLEAKSQISYGTWIDWVREHCEMDERLAQRYMRVAKHWPKLTAELSEADTTRVSHLSFRQALELIPRNAQATINVEPEQRGRLLAHAEQADYLSIGPSARELHEEAEERERQERYAEAEASRREQARRHLQQEQARLRRRRERLGAEGDEPDPAEERAREQPFDAASLGEIPTGPAVAFNPEGGYRVDPAEVHACMREVEASLTRLLAKATEVYGPDDRRVHMISGLRGSAKQTLYEVRRRSEME
jgi:hypothetical protein